MAADYESLNKTGNANIALSNYIKNLNSASKVYGAKNTQSQINQIEEKENQFSRNLNASTELAGLKYTNPDGEEKTFLQGLGTGAKNIAGGTAQFAQDKMSSLSKYMDKRKKNKEYVTAFKRYLATRDESGPTGIPLNEDNQPKQQAIASDENGPTGIRSDGTATPTFEGEAPFKKTFSNYYKQNNTIDDLEKKSNLSAKKLEDIKLQNSQIKPIDELEINQDFYKKSQEELKNSDSYKQLLHTSSELKNKVKSANKNLYKAVSDKATEAELKAEESKYIANAIKTGNEESRIRDNIYDENGDMTSEYKNKVVDESASSAVWSSIPPARKLEEARKKADNFLKIKKQELKRLLKNSTRGKGSVFANKKESRKFSKSGLTDRQTNEYHASINNYLKENPDATEKQIDKYMEVYYNIMTKDNKSKKDSTATEIK